MSFAAAVAQRHIAQALHARHGTLGQAWDDCAPSAVDAYLTDAAYIVGALERAGVRFIVNLPTPPQEA